MRFAKTAFLASTILSLSALQAHADVAVVTSIKPVHSLVSLVMDGVGEPGLIVEGAGSPHTYALKPSHARQLEGADIIFWMGHELEAFLERPLVAIAPDATVVALADTPALTRYGFRGGGAFDTHGHGDHDAHAGNEHDDHAGHKHDDHGHEDHRHAQGGFDPHVWLDPVNAKALVYAIEDALSAADPANKASYEENAAQVADRLDRLVAEVSTELAPVRRAPFVVFHDAYQAFEARFGLAAVGSITVSPEVMPGVKRISELRSKVGELGAVCVFSEPQFEPRLVSTVTEGTGAKSGVLDPLGASIASGPDLYFMLIRNMTDAFTTCLSETR